MTDQPKKLAQMTPEEAAPIMEAWRTGKPLLLRYGADEWGPRLYPKEGLDLKADYRLPPAEPTVHPALWEIVPEWCNYIVQECNGDIWMFSVRSDIGETCWLYRSGKLSIAFLSPTALSWPEGTPWQERIIARPGYEEDSED